MSTEPLRILLVDDHVFFREGVASLLAARKEMEVVGQAEDGLDALIKARETMPDLVLMDINMPKCNGVQATLLIKKEMPHVRVIMLTVSDSDHDLFAAIKNGADGYLLKNVKPSDLFTLLEGIRRGEAALPGALAMKILQQFRHLDRASAKKSEESETLTAREFEILEQVASGATNKEIAATLSISENTVRNHLRNILDKLHLQNRIQAAVYAVQHGLAAQPSPDP